MDLSESTQAVYDRIQELDLENVPKIFEYLQSQDLEECDMIRLAYSPDSTIQSLIKKAKADLCLSKQLVSAPICVPQVNSFSVMDLPLGFTPRSGPINSKLSLEDLNAYWDSQLPASDHQLADFGLLHHLYPGFLIKKHILSNQIQFLPSDEQVSLNMDALDMSNSFYFLEPTASARISQKSPSLTELPVKVCYHFNKGYCRNGSKCRSVEKLELEVIEILKLRRRVPLSIASLPILYYQKFIRRTLQAYLTERRQHGKTGYNLTELPAQMTDKICLIDRPHGKPSIILSKDFLKYLEKTHRKRGTGGIVPGSLQIYLTLPANSVFTEQDVSNYFRTFGPVEDVRIPSLLQKRMFGFVILFYLDTVRQVLSKGNPQYVCGVRFPVKPYSEKPKTPDRTYTKKVQHDLSHDHRFLDFDSDSGLSCAEQGDTSSAEYVNHFLEVFKNCSISGNTLGNLRTRPNDPNSSQDPNLPESPFSSPMGSRVPTIA